MPKVSVIIPTYNREKLLSRAIKSVLKQTFQDFELIVVDDGSTDSTEALMDKFQKKDKRIRYIKLKKHYGGPAKAKNVGIQYSKGKYIATLDSDDEWLPEKLELQIKLFETSPNPRLGFVSCHALQIDTFSGKKSIFKIKKPKNLFEAILTHDMLGSGSGMAYKKEALKKVGLFDENLKHAQDWEIRIRLAKEYDFDLVDKVLYKYYVHKESITHSFSIVKKEKDLRYILLKYEPYYRENPRIYSLRLKYDGSRYIRAGEQKKALKYFLRSIRYNPLNIRSWICLFFSFFGPRVYSKVSEFKRRVKLLSKMNN